MSKWLVSVTFPVLPVEGDPVKNNSALRWETHCHKTANTLQKKLSAITRAADSQYFSIFSKWSANVIIKVKLSKILSLTCWILQIYLWIIRFIFKKISPFRKFLKVLDRRSLKSKLCNCSEAENTFAYQLTVDNDNVHPDSGVVQRRSKNTGRRERWNRMFWMRGAFPDGEAAKEDLQSVVDADLPRNHIGGSTVHVEADLVTGTLLGHARPWRRCTFIINAQPTG